MDAYIFISTIVWVFLWVFCGFFFFFFLIEVYFKIQGLNLSTNSEDYFGT